MYMDGGMDIYYAFSSNDACKTYLFYCVSIGFLGVFCLFLLVQNSGYGKKLLIFLVLKGLNRVFDTTEGLEESVAFIFTFGVTLL